MGKGAWLRAGVAGSLIWGLLAVGGRPCVAAVRVQLLVIGNNRPFAGGHPDSPDPTLPTLRFADDDAVAFYRLMSEVADTAHLLTVMDAETQSSNPNLAGVARPPTREALRSAVQALRRRIDDNRLRGDRNVLYIFFSGHGSMVEADGPALALLDGGISHPVLYDEILSQLPADRVHVLIDACHAEAVVRPRDSQAKQLPISAAEAANFLTRSTLARFPHVGAILAASGDANAHEWDLLGHGVFTYEILSALRGAADVNHDGLVEYSEVYAFLAAANRGVTDARARLHIIARPPEIDRRAALVDLSRWPVERSARIEGVPARAGYVQVEDGDGRRLASLRGEPGFVTNLVVPAGTTYVRSGDQEARIESRPGQVVPFDALNFRDPPARSRGAIEDAVRRGLFATEFGPGYYRGFVDQAPDFLPVALPVAEVARRPQARVSTAAAAPEDRAPLAGARLMFGVGASIPVARALDESQALRIGVYPGSPSGGLLSADLYRAAGAGAAEWRAIGAAGWLWSLRLGSARGWLGGTVGGGAIAQTASGKERWSGLLAAGPMAGLGATFVHRLGGWIEARLPATAYRRDGRSALSLTPSVFLGVSVGL